MTRKDIDDIEIIKRANREKANKLDEGYDLYKDIEVLAEYAKSHDLKGKMHQDLFYSHAIMDVKRLDEIPRRLAIYLIRLLNTFRERSVANEYIDVVIDWSGSSCKLFMKITESVVGEEKIKKYKKERERLENIPLSLHVGDIYDIFTQFVDYIFQSWSFANFFMYEPELKITGTVFDEYSPEVNPDNIKKIEDLTQKDLVRLLRIINSFRRRDIVDKFVTDIGDFEDLYDLLYLFVGYVFQDYKNANFFLDEPELSSDPKYIPWQITMFGGPTVRENPNL